MEVGLILPRIHGEVANYYQMQMGLFGAIDLPHSGTLHRKGEMALIYGSSKDGIPVLQMRGSAFLLQELPLQFRLGPSLQFWMLKDLKHHYPLMQSGETDFGLGLRLEWQKESPKRTWGCFIDENVAFTLPKQTWITGIGCSIGQKFKF